MILGRTVNPVSYPCHQHTPQGPDGDLDRPLLGFPVTFTLPKFWEKVLRFCVSDFDFLPPCFPVATAWPRMVSGAEGQEDPSGLLLSGDLER